MVGDRAILTSANGAEWTRQTHPLPATNSLWSVAFGTTCLSLSPRKVHLDFERRRFVDGAGRGHNQLPHQDHLCPRPVRAVACARQLS